MLRGRYAIRDAGWALMGICAGTARRGRTVRSVERPGGEVSRHRPSEGHTGAHRHDRVPGEGRLCEVPVVRCDGFEDARRTVLS